MSQKKASILIISLWVLAILVTFAIALGYRASINLKLAKYQQDKLRALCLAKAALQRIIFEIDKDVNNYDTSCETWADNKEIFSKITLAGNKNGFATISYINGEGEIKFGATDEERKININKATPEMLKELFISKGFDIDAGVLAGLIIEWINDTKESEAKKKIFKNASLASPEELLIILQYFYQDEEKAHKIYNAVKDLITVRGSGKVNINTTSRDILTILARSSAANPEQKNFVTRVVDTLIASRDAQVDKAFKNVGDIKIGISVDANEEALFNNLLNYLVVASNYLKIEIKSHGGETVKNITVVYDRSNKKIVYWHEY